MAGITLTCKQKNLLETTFGVVFSALILVLFYSVTSMNGLVMGNDPAVHMEKANIFLDTGQIPLENLGWTPPLFQILLAVLISFTGATSISQLILIEKALAVLIDWLLFFSVYLIGSKFFGKKIGGIASVLLLFCVPMFELNLWGGYTTVLGLAFLFLLLLYLPFALKTFEHIIIAFFVAFSLVLSHQLTAFLTVLILPPIIFFMLIKSRGKHFKALIAVILGGGIAFVLYYSQAMLPYLGVIIEHVFFMQKTTLYQIPGTTLNAFMVNFGFIFVISLAGIVISFLKLRAKKQTLFFLILFTSFIVPFVLAESYLFGLYLPFQWFIYYLMPPTVILAAVSISFAANKVAAFYHKYKGQRWKKLPLQTITVSLIALVSLLLIFRFGTVYGKIMEGSVYYSTSDIKAYDAGTWLRNNYPDETTVVVTEVPGFWFRLYSGKTIIAETDPIIERNAIASTVLELAYEIEHPLTLVRAYDETKGHIADENYVSMNDVWRKVSYSAADGNKILYQAKGVNKEIPLSHFARESFFEDQGSTKKLTFRYFNDEVIITQTTIIQNEMYPINVAWSLIPEESGITDVALYVSNFFDLQFSFEEAYIPGILDWENPWSSSSYSQGDGWAVVNFSRSTVTDNYLGFYDGTEEVVFALNFYKLPDWGNVGVLESNQIDAVRFQYNFDEVAINQTVSFSYDILAFSKNSAPEIPNVKDLKSIFEFKPTNTFELKSRDYHDYIMENNIGFLVYDKNQLDTKLIRCKILEVVYSNDRYIIFKINTS